MIADTPEQHKFDRYLEEIDVFSLAGRDNPEFFERFRKKSFEGEFDPSEFHVSGRHDRHYCWDPDPYVDARHPLALRHNGRVRIMSAFQVVKYDEEYGIARSDLLNLSPERDFPIVAQLQGQLGANHYVGSLKWERLLVTIVEDWAREAGFSACLGLPASENPHYPNSPQAHLRYDVTFKRMGYKMHNGFWRKELHPVMPSE